MNEFGQLSIRLGPGFAGWLAWVGRRCPAALGSEGDGVMAAAVLTRLRAESGTVVPSDVGTSAG